VGGRAHDLEGDVLAGSVVAGQPDGGEVAPAQLAHNGVLAVLVLLADLDGMVAALAVLLSSSSAVLSASSTLDESLSGSVVWCTERLHPLIALHPLVKSGS
jgi:hypothetical protein